jgi:translocation and assembly module TamA
MVCVFLRRCAFALLFVAAGPAQAIQAVPSVEPLPVDPPGTDLLDPGSPLAPLPDLGVAWPDMSQPDAAIEPAAATVTTPATTKPATTTTTTTDAASERRYRIAIEGIDAISDSRLRTRFDELSTLRAGAGSAANTAQIDRRAREDEALLADLLRGLGYYDADIATRIASEADGRILVTLVVEPGELYRFTTVAVTGIEADPALREAFAIAVDDAVDAEKVQAAEAALGIALGRRGYAFAKVGKPDIVVDHEKRSAVLAIAVDAGAPQTFGALRIEGRRPFGPRHLARIARFDSGDRYDAARLEDFRRALIATGLVSTVDIKPVPSATPGVVDVAVRIERAPQRTIAGELGYGTGEGYRAEVSWTHRNLIRPEGAVTFRGVAGTREQLLGASLRRSNFRTRDQVLTGQIVASHEKRDAYDARTLTVAAGIERQTNIIWQKKWTWSAGIEIAASDERDTIISTGVARQRTFIIGALPGTLAYDGSDDLLNPTRGFRLAGRLSPELSFQNSTFGYARAQIDASIYQPIGGGKLVIAARTRLATIAGASRDRIAPSRRFYSGGGGSVRGFGYQAIGPRDANNDPVGGRSLTEFAIEARVRFGNFGVVPFIDAGNLYTTPLPQFTGLRFGAGIGARYYTSFGPIRVDVGTPINPRQGDARVAVYVSLGQAF